MFGYRGGVSETQYAGTFSPFILQGVQYPLDIKYLSYQYLGLHFSSTTLANGNWHEQVNKCTFRYDMID